MSLPNAETIAKVQEWRRKMADGTITLEEQKEAIIYLRQNRQSAKAAAAKKPSSRTKKPTQSAEDMLSELD